MRNDSHNIIIPHAHPCRAPRQNFRRKISHFSLFRLLARRHCGSPFKRPTWMFGRTRPTPKSSVRPSGGPTRHACNFVHGRNFRCTTSGPNLPYEVRGCVATSGIIIVWRVIRYSPGSECQAPFARKSTRGEILNFRRLRFYTARIFGPCRISVQSD